MFFFCRVSLFFFKINCFKIFFQEHCQGVKVWFKIRPDILLGLIWIESVCKDHQQMAKFAELNNLCILTSMQKV